MNRATAKLLRGFCKVTGQKYRQMKKDFYTMKPKDKHDSRVKLRRFWSENLDVLDHRKYKDLKKPLVKSSDAASLV
jgi:hypothetical protein